VRQEHRERPAAAALREHLVGELVDLVEVRPLFAIDLDVDEQLVHERRRRRVLEGFVGHHVAPVAGGISDRQQDRLARGAGELERFRAPCMPVHGIGCVLLQVGTGFPGQTVLGRIHRPVE
jgi:hypothetical protein